MIYYGIPIIFKNKKISKYLLINRIFQLLSAKLYKTTF